MVYKITCPQCQMCYVGQTARHLVTRYKEHVSPRGLLRKHFDECNVDPSFDVVSVLEKASNEKKHYLSKRSNLSWILETNLEVGNYFDWVGFLYLVDFGLWYWLCPLSFCSVCIMICWNNEVVCLTSLV